MHQIRGKKQITIFLQEIIKRTEKERKIGNLEKVKVDIRQNQKEKESFGGKGGYIQEGKGEYSQEGRGGQTHGGMSQGRNEGKRGQK